MSQVIKLGENALITRTLKQSDGSQLLYSALTGAAVELRQNGAVVATKTLGTDPELRAGAGSDTLLLEITTALRAELNTGVDLELHWWTTTADAGFVEDSTTHRDWAHDATIDVFTLDP